MNTVIKITGLIIILLAGFSIYIYSGIYNVAARAPHTGAMQWVMEKTKERSIRYHSNGITPPALDDGALVIEGFGHYDAMCVGCHGAPGQEPAPGFNPDPPALTEEARELKPEEVFWVVKNGIKMTGMPEFGSSHEDEEIWAIAAFVNELPGMTESEYGRMKKQSQESTHNHRH